jgi:hypothetical protein
MTFTIESGSMTESRELDGSVDRISADEPAARARESSSRAGATAHVVLSPSRRSKKHIRDREGASTGILLALALTFLAIGFVDLILLWFPTQLGNAAWEFATVSRTLDAFPMLAMGVGLFAFGVVLDSKSTTRAALGAAAGSAILMVAVILAGAIYGTAAPAVLGGAPAEAMVGVRRALIKGAIQLAAYTALFAAIALTLLKRLRGSG